MERKDILIFDFDDTVVETTKHICDCYSRITGDEISNLDFFAEFTWDNNPRYKELFRNIINAIQDDPSKLKLVEGFKKFIDTLKTNYNCEFLILSKRSGIHQIKWFISNNIPNTFFKYAFVSSAQDKGIVLERICRSGLYKEIIYFEDRMDMIASCKSHCTRVYKLERAWNRLCRDTNDLKTFSSYNELITDANSVNIFSHIL